MTLGSPDGKIGTPRIGETCYVWTRVYNRTDANVEDGEVCFWFCPPGSRLRRADSIFLGRSFVSIGAHEDFNDVLCVSSWTPQFDHAMHGCLIAEIKHWLDPFPEEAQFNTWDFTQIGQRNINLHKLADSATTWQTTFTVPDLRGEATDVSVSVVREKPIGFEGLLSTLGLPDDTAFSTAERVSVGLSEIATGELRSSLQLQPKPGTSTIVFLSAKANGKAESAVQLVEVVERVGPATIGGLLYVFVLPE
jgi:hypothetical protein